MEQDFEIASSSQNEIITGKAYDYVRNGEYFDHIRVVSGAGNKKAGATYIDMIPGYLISVLQYKLKALHNFRLVNNIWD